MPNIRLEEDIHIEKRTEDVFLALSTADIAPDAWYIANSELYVFTDRTARDEWVSGLAEGSLEAFTTNWGETLAKSVKVL